jgi:hypothetical protein
VTPSQAVVLVGIIHATFPAMKVDEYTPDAWEPILLPLGFDEAKAAVAGLGARMRFIAPADIVAELAAKRRDLLERTPDAVPDCDPDDTAGYIRALREGRYRTARGLARTRPVAALTSRAFRSVPRPDSARQLPASGRRSELPKWATVVCPICEALPGDLCTIPESAPAVKRPDPHGRRIKEAHRRADEGEAP